MTDKQRCVALALALAMGLAAGQGVRLAAVPAGRDGAQAAAARDQPVRNGSFEDVSGAEPAGWRAAQFQRGAQFSVETAGRTAAAAPGSPRRKAPTRRGRRWRSSGRTPGTG